MACRVALPLPRYPCGLKPCRLPCLPLCFAALPAVFMACRLPYPCRFACPACCALHSLAGSFHSAAMLAPCRPQSPVMGHK